MKRVAVAALVLFTACAGSPNQRPERQARATTTSTAHVASGALARCRGTDLAVQDITQDGASGHVLYFVPLRNVSAKPCELSGYPRVTATAGDSDLNAVHDGAYFPDPTGGAVGPGATGLAVIDANTHCAEDYPTTAIATYTRIRLELPGGGSISLGNLNISTCQLSVTQLGVSANGPPPNAAPKCNGGELHAADDVTGAAMSHTIERIHLKNVSTQACWLFGFPVNVTARTRDGRVEKLSVGATYAPAPEPGEIVPGGFGEVLVETTTACEEMTLPQPRHVVYSHVSIDVPGGGTVSLDPHTFDASCSIVVSALGAMTNSPA